MGKRYQYLAALASLILGAISQVASAGILMELHEPTGNHAAQSWYDAKLEVSSKLDELKRYHREGVEYRIRTSILVCHNAGWFAASSGENRQNSLQNAVGLSCGASTKSEATKVAIKACQNKAGSGIMCELMFVKFDPGNISFLAEFRPVDFNNDGKYSFEPRNKPNGSAASYGCCHAKYSGLDNSTPAFKRKSSTRPRTDNSAARKQSPKAKEQSELAKRTLLLKFYGDSCGDSSYGSERALVHEKYFQRNKKLMPWEMEYSAWEYGVSSHQKALKNKYFTDSEKLNLQKKLDSYSCLLEIAGQSKLNGEN